MNPSMPERPDTGASPAVVPAPGRAKPAGGALDGRGARPSLRDEVRLVAWLQRRQLVNALRHGHSGTKTRILSVVLLLLFALPYVAFLGGGLALALRVLPPSDGTALVAGGFTFLLLMWVASPVTNQELLEGPNLTRLFVHPISFHGLVVAGVVVGLASFLTLFTLPFLAAVVAGAARGPLSAAGVIVAALAFLMLLVTAKAVAADGFELVAEDRRLRGAVATLVALGLGGFWFMLVGVPDMGDSDARPFLDAMRAATWLRWLPAGWFATAVEAAMTGRVATWGGACLAILTAAALGLALHVRLQRRLYFGHRLRLAPPRAAATAALAEPRRVPGLSAADSRAFRALVRKDRLNLRRNPFVTRIAVLPVMFMFMSFYLTRNIEMPAWVMGLGVGAMASLLTASLSLNGLALLDHRGLGTLFRSPAPRWLALLSHGLVYLAVAAGCGLLMSAAVAAAARSLAPVPIGVATALAVQLLGNGVAHVASVRFPYYVDIEGGRQSPEMGSLLATILLFLALPLLALPVGAVVVGAWVLARPLVPLALAGSLAYAIAVYAVLLRVAARMLERREPDLVATIVEARG